jgi:Xaa-Pro aminopeptidase
MAPRAEPAAQVHAAQVHAARRRRVLDALGTAHAPGSPGGAAASGIAGAAGATGTGSGDGAVLIIAAAPELYVGPDTALRYVPDADLYWLTGYTEPEAVLVLAPAAATPYTLFVRDRDPDRERWTGVRGGAAAARDVHGADAAFPLAALETELPKLVAGAARLFVRQHAGRPDVDDAVQRLLRDALAARPRTGRGPHTVTDPALLLGPMRRVKDAHEIALMREACAISAAGFAAARAALDGARGEWQVEAALEHEFRSRGAAGPAFPSIVAGGANATVLHYTGNDAPLRRGSLLLVDAGARYRMYCGDISRTWPVGGTAAPEQQAVYDVVQHAHAAGLAAALPGATIADVHHAALDMLVDGMLALGLLAGERAAIMEQAEYRRYYPHRTSHWLGLDVHDAGDYVTAPDTPVVLEEGMILTVEPGLYIPADDDAAPVALRGIGVRIEDDVLITGDGHEVLTAAAPS